jgi:type I restriction enzyme M protein
MTEQDRKQVGETPWNIAGRLRESMDADAVRDNLLPGPFLRYLLDSDGGAV